MGRQGRQVEPDQLVDRAIKFDPEALGALYDLYYTRVYRFALLRVGTREDAEDLTQEVFLKVVENIERFRQSGAPFIAWVMKIARNTVADFFRRAVRGAQRETAITALEATRDLTETYAWSTAEARQLLDTLSPDQREVLVLKFFSDLTNEEIASATGRSVGAVKSLQHRGLGALARAIGSETS